MKTIIEGKPNIKRLLGKQQVKDTAYRMMKYVLRAECEDGILLYNVITSQMVLLERDDMSAITSSFDTSSETRRELIEAYYIVSDAFDERTLVKQLRVLLRKLSRPTGINGYTILTTTNCNARCFYCYEADFQKINMDETTADHLVDYMLKHKGSGGLRLSWFGGEPLLHSKRIDQICERLIREEVQFGSTMISNGFLFTEEMIQRAISIWKLKMVQITLDGTEPIYNRTKAYVGQIDSPYQRVMKNIGMLLENDIRVSIRLNLDQHNDEDLMQLIDELYERFGNYDKLDVYSHVLFENQGYAPIQRSDAAAADLYGKQGLINAHLEEIGLKKRQLSIPSLKKNRCMADGDTSVCVFPDGQLFKCEHTGANEEFGHIDTGIDHQENIERYQKTVELEHCADCPLYPSCILLEACNGLKDHNMFTCSEEVASSIRAIRSVYSRKMTGNFPKGLDRQKKV